MGTCPWILRQNPQGVNEEGPKTECEFTVHRGPWIPTHSDTEGGEMDKTGCPPPQPSASCVMVFGPQTGQSKHVTPKKNEAIPLQKPNGEMKHWSRDIPNMSSFGPVIAKCARSIPSAPPPSMNLPRHGTSRDPRWNVYDQQNSTCTKRPQRFFTGPSERKHREETLINHFLVPRG